MHWRASVPGNPQTGLVEGDTDIEPMLQPAPPTM